MRFKIKTYQREKVFYEAMWFDFDNLYEDTPFVRGYDVSMIIDKLLHITKDQSGSIEVYKFTYNNPKVLCKPKLNFI